MPYETEGNLNKVKKLLFVLVTVIIAVSLSTAIGAADLSDVLTAYKDNDEAMLEGYSFDNPLQLWPIPDTLRIEFDLTVTGQTNPYGTVFCFNNRDGLGRFLFTMGAGLFYNNWSGYWFDAGVHNSVYDDLLSEHSGSTVHIVIKITEDDFSVSFDGDVVYDSAYLMENLNSAGAFYGEGLTEEYISVITYICLRQKLDFGFNEWWTTLGIDDTNADIADFKIFCDDELVATYFISGEVGNNQINSPPAETETEEIPETSDETPDTEEKSEETDTDINSDTSPKTSPEGDSDKKEKKGCRSTLGVNAAITTFVCIFGTAMIRRKKK